MTTKPFFVKTKASALAIFSSRLQYPAHSKSTLSTNINQQNTKGNIMKTKKFCQAVKGMQVDKWEIREFSNGKRKLYAQFVPKKPQIEVVVKKA
jgi:hypothetical protein